VDPNKLHSIQGYIDTLAEYNDKASDLLNHAVRLAGKNFL